MAATKTQTAQVKDPICGMMIDPATAAGTSERDDTTYYFCSLGCKAKFDAATQAHTDAPAMGSCCGGETTDEAQIPAPIKIAPVNINAPSHRHAAAHATSTGAQAAPAPSDAQAAAQEREYRRMMRKFWFAAAIAMPVLLAMLVDIIPAWHEATMRWHQLIGLATAIITLPVLAY